MPDDDLRMALDRLTAQVAALNQRNARLMRMLGMQMLRGLAFGLGSVLGATLLVSVIGWWVAQFEFVPLIGAWAAQIADEITRARNWPP